MKNLLSVALIMSALGAFAQCPPQITCPGNITVSNDPGKCSAVVHYNTPNGIDTCLSGSQTFNYSGVIDTFIVPLGLTTITIEAWGAQGGTGNWAPPGNPGGKGAYIKGDVTVSGGDTILVLVGEMGETQGTGGGGGGSFTAIIGNTPLVIAGGGGGGSFDEAGVDASTTQNGTMDSQNAVNGGTAGSGGSVCGINQNDGGGGGGFLTDGADAVTSNGGGYGGKAFVNGGAGAPRGINGTSCTGCAGGFGGGGSGSCNTVGGGGGGGYSGGAGGKHYNNCISNATRAGGGGGGSFNAGTNTADSAGVRTGNGLVRITWNGAGVTTNQTAGLPSGSVFPVGTTTNTFVTSNSAGTDSCSFTVTVNDTNATPSLAALTQDTICTSAGSITLPAGSPAGGVYSGAGVTGNMFDPAAAEKGDHWIYYTDTSGCDHADSVLITVVWCTGINEEQILSGVEVAPNPSNGQFNINVGEGVNAKISVMDIVGRTVMEQTEIRRAHTLDISNEEAGVYLLKVEINGVFKSIRLIKE